MKIDKELMSAFEAGKVAGRGGEGYRANPFYYTSAMSRAWDLGRALIVNSRMDDVAKIIGLSSRGLTFEDSNRRTRRYCTSEIRCTGAYEHWPVTV